MLKLILYVFTSPILEWIVHYLLHLTENSFHNKHHTVVYINRYEKFSQFENVELWPLICIIMCYKFNLIFCLITFLRYWTCHTFIHFSKDPNNYLVRHHYTHHKYKKYNLCVSAIWPDYLFNTKYIKKKN